MAPKFNPTDGGGIAAIRGATVYRSFNDVVDAQRKAGGGTIVAIQGTNANFAILLGTPDNWYWEYANKASGDLRNSIITG